MPALADKRIAPPNAAAVHTATTARDSAAMAITLLMFPDVVERLGTAPVGQPVSEQRQSVGEGKRLGDGVEQPRATP